MLMTVKNLLEHCNISQSRTAENSGMNSIAIVEDRDTAIM